MASTAGYSGTPLPKKLGIQAGTRFAVVNAPDHFDSLVDPLPAGAARVDDHASLVDIVILFVMQRDELVAHWAELTEEVGPFGAVWVAWPKKASKVPTDITEDVVREVLLPSGWVDVKVCAIDDTWSGLKLVMRKELR